MDSPSPADHLRAVLILGKLVDDGVTSSIKARGFRYVHRILHSGPENWWKICRAFHGKIDIGDASVTIDTVLAKLTEHTLFLAVQPEYIEVRKALFAQLAAKPHVVFLFENNLLGHFSFDAPPPDTDDDDLFSRFRDAYGTSRLAGDADSQKMVREFINELKADGFNLVPYRTTAEATLAAQNFIDEMDKHLALRLYIPSEQLWHDQTDRLLTLFKDYVSKVSGQDLQLAQRRTASGTIYEFFFSKKGSSQAPHVDFNEFSQFLELCLHNPDSAETLLRKAGQPEAAASELISRYSREARRLLVDIEYERNSKLLRIQHRLHSELLDVFPPDELKNILSLAASILPVTAEIAGVTHVLTSAGSMAITVPPMTSSKIRQIIREEVSGRRGYSADDDFALNLIQQNAGDQISALAAAFSEFRDAGTDAMRRTRARQELIAFIAKIQPKLSKPEQDRALALFN